MFASSITDHFGSKLLGDVLTHFSDLTPRLPEEHGKPGSKAEPQLSQWTASNCIQPRRLRGPRCRKNFFRKYMVQAASRGADASGHYAPTPSPSMFSDESGQTGSRAETPVSRAETPIRHRLPKAAQQFPALVASKLTTSSMKHTHVNHQASDHSNKKDAHDDDDDDRAHDHFKPRTVVAVEGVEQIVPFRHSAKPRLIGQPIRFESHFVHPDTPASGSSSPPIVQPGSFSAPEADARTVPKPALNNLKPAKKKTVDSRFSLNLASLAPDDSDDEKKEGIRNESLGSSKYDRMRRINAKRRVKESVVVIGDRDKVVTYDDLELAKDSFHRYFKNKRPFDEARLISALSDFGVVGRSKSEKTVLFLILAQHMGKDENSFKDFCSIIEDARLRVRACRFSNIFSAWRQVDRDDIGALSVPKVVELLKLLGLGPENGNEMLCVQACISEMHKDAADLYPLTEVEYVCQQLRENVESRRRRDEREVQKKYHLSGPTFNEFRTQILELYETFKKLDEDGSGKLGGKEVVHLLSEFGIVNGLHGSEAKDRMERELHIFLGEMHGKDENNSDEADIEMNFAWFLQFLKNLRKASMDSSYESVSILFQAYDKNRNGELEMKDVCSIIQELGMQPRTHAEQEAIGELLEDVDEDGSGTLHLEELLNMCVRIAERRAQFQRNAENAKAESLNLSRHQKYELRRAFDTLDADASGELNLSEVITAVHKYMAQWNLPPYQIRQIFMEVDEDGNGSVDFIEFMELMARIDAEVKLLEDEDNNKKEKKLQAEVKEVKAKAEDGDQGTPGSNDRSPAKPRSGVKHTTRRQSVHPSSEQRKQLEKR